MKTAKTALLGRFLSFVGKILVCQNFCRPFTFQRAGVRFRKGIGCRSKLN